MMEGRGGNKKKAPIPWLKPCNRHFCTTQGGKWGEELAMEEKAGNWQATIKAKEKTKASRIMKNKNKNKKGEARTKTKMAALGALQVVLLYKKKKVKGKKKTKNHGLGLGVNNKVVVVGVNVGGWTVLGYFDRKKGRLAKDFSEDRR
uniref:Uncharacterized protein n=1 Tax=Trypanosoma vivax (strain Y486) TaxID=1055687 RepID=G0U036_TRYVY|nr:hypothetical protein, unlikely [Trypanosoma vivax Y486]